MAQCWPSCMLMGRENEFVPSWICRAKTHQVSRVPDSPCLCACWFNLSLLPVYTLRVSDVQEMESKSGRILKHLLCMTHVPVKHRHSSPFVLERIRNKHSKRDPTITLSKSLCFHTRSILRVGILKEPGCLYPPRSESNHPSHSICVPSHLLKTMRAEEVVTTSQVHCLVGANARTKPGKAPPSPNPGNSLACAQRKGVG